VQRLQADEIWSFVGAKAKNVTAEQEEAGWGDVWTWTAIDADTKLIVSYLVGLRDDGYAFDFITDLKGRLADRVQLTTDGHHPYLDAIKDAFNNNIDYAQLIKHYGKEPGIPAGRYSPAVCTSCEPHTITGNPDPAHISTSFSERHNLTIRMSNRRFTRLTNAHSKKIQNHERAVTLNIVHYNFCRIHSTIRVTPAMQAGLTDHVWEVEELLALLD
jgi:IS1 family transposase